MFLYTAGGLNIRSNLSLPELLPGGSPSQADDDQRTRCTFALCPAREREPAVTEWFHHWRWPDGAIHLSFSRAPFGYLLRFPGVADFTVSADGREIRCYPAPGTAEDVVRWLLLDQVLPLIHGMVGRWAWHASAVAVDDLLLAFIGPSRRGKSTLAASLCRAGSSLVTDDCLIVEQEGERLTGRSNYPGLRLWTDSANAVFGTESGPCVAGESCKRHFGVEDGLAHTPNPLPIHAVYVPRPADETDDPGRVTIAPLAARDAFISLVQFTYRLDLSDRSVLQRDFDGLARLSTLPLFYALVVPRDLSRLPLVCDRILEHVDALSRQGFFRASLA